MKRILILLAILLLAPCAFCQGSVTGNGQITVGSGGPIGTPAYASNGSGCPLSNDQNQTSDHVTAYHCQLPNSTIAGNLLVLLLRYDSPAQTPTFTDNVGGSSYTQAVSCTDSTNGVVSAIYYVSGVKAGVNAVTVHLSSTQFVQMQPYEFFNASTLDKATCNSSSGTTPTVPALGTLVNGDLVFQQVVVDSTQNISGCTKGSQANISWTLRSTMIADKYPSCVQFGVYNSTTSFAPTMTLGTSVSGFITAAAAFKAAAAGSAPTSGIRVAFIQHDDSDNEQATSVTLQNPVQGNAFAVLYGSGCAGSSSTDCSYPTAIADGTNTWTQVGGNIVSPTSDGGGSVGATWYAKGVTAGTYAPTYTMHARSSGGNGNSWFFFDITGASANPLDTTLGLASNTGDQASGGAGGNLTSLTLTPSQANEVILTQVGAAFNTFTGAASPTGSVFQAANYITETNSSHCDLNAALGIFYNGSSTASQSWVWQQDASGSAGVGDWMSTGVAFH